VLWGTHLDISCYPACHTMRQKMAPGISFLWMSGLQVLRRPGHPLWRLHDGATHGHVANSAWP
jgi:hypothetical protein